jgi:hypothetical protein
VSYETEAVADTVQGLANARLSASLIDVAHQNGKLDSGVVVATSLGSVSRALLTPYYPEIQFDNSIFDRLDAASRNSQPFVEAHIKVSGEDVRRPTQAQVILRLCMEPDETAVSEVKETRCTYNLSDSICYGTTDRVVDEIYRRRTWGEFNALSTGTVKIPAKENRGKHGKWRLRSSDEPQILARNLSQDINSIRFAGPLDLIN